MLKRFTRLILSILIIGGLFCIQSPGLASAVGFGDIDIDGDGNINIIQAYFENLVFNSSTVQPIQNGYTNEDVVQIYVNNLYNAYDKEDAQEYLPTTILNSFNTSQLRGWSSSLGYQYVLFGRYYQDRLDQPILWRVLSVSNGDALLLSEYILDTRPFDNNSNVWENSDLKYWLNGTFYNNAFSQAEKNAILDNGSIGKVFILSSAELSNTAYGFQKSTEVRDSNRSASGSMYAFNNGLWVVQDSDYTNYFTRTKPNKTNVGLVTSSGKIMLAKIDRDNVGIRPAIWVDIDKLPFTNGDGGIAYPFQ